MATLSYLIENRARFPLGSHMSLRAWAKRLMTFPELLRRNRRRHYLTRNGSNIHECAEIGKIKADGNKQNLTIGAFSFLGKAELALHASIKIGERVCINDGVRILTASHDVSDPEWKHIKAAIFIDDYAWIGTNALILPGVKIGRGAVVGAGAVVSKDVLPRDIVAGNPARVLNRKRSESLKYNPCEFLAANQAWIKG